MQITNCKNCGAPLKGSKCEYCGTIYNFNSCVPVEEMKYEPYIDAHGRIHRGVPSHLKKEKWL